jgi:hypothetical protein
VGCFTQGSRLWVCADKTVREPLSTFLPDDLPLLCCDVRVADGMAFAVGGGLCPSQLVCGVLLAEGSEDGAEEATKRQRTEQEVRVTSIALSVSDRGCVNAVAVHMGDGKARSGQWSVALFLGCQSGDVVRLSLLVTAAGGVTTVGGETVVSTHRMDVRGLALSPGARLCSCGDDGVLQVAHVAGGTLPLIEPLQLTRGAELLCVAWIDEDTVVVGTRDRRLVRVDLGLDGQRRKRDPTWTAATLPIVARSVGRNGLVSDGKGLFRFGSAWESVAAASLEHAKEFHSVLLAAALL